MKVRIRLQTGRPIQRKHGKNRHLALAGGALLIPVSVLAYVLGFWSLASELGMAGAFGITGLFSHWQLWMAFAVAVHLSAGVLGRYGRGGGLELPSVLKPRLLPLRNALSPWRRFLKAGRG